MIQDIVVWTIIVGAVAFMVWHLRGGRVRLSSKKPDVSLGDLRQSARKNRAPYRQQK